MEQSDQFIKDELELNTFVDRVININFFLNYRNCWGGGGNDGAISSECT